MEQESKNMVDEAFTAREVEGLSMVRVLSTMFAWLAVDEAPTAYWILAVWSKARDINPLDMLAVDFQGYFSPGQMVDLRDAHAKRRDGDSEVSALLGSEWSDNWSE